MSDKTGIRQRIAAATTVSEVKRLLAQVRNYDWVSAKTLSACASTSRRRIQFLQATKKEKSNAKG